MDDAHKQKVITRRLNGSWFSKEALENIKKANTTDDWKTNQKISRENSEYFRMKNIRRFFKRLDKFKLMTKRQYPIKLCKCGKEFQSQNEFCSRKCFYKYRKKPEFYELRPEKRGKNFNKRYRKVTYRGRRIGEHIAIILKENNWNKLPSGFCVHHKDLDISNNARENLELMTIKKHDKLHAELKKLITPLTE
jgi:hypothetical protein